MLRPFYTTAPNGWPFNELETSLEAATRDPDARASFWNTLLDSNLYVLAMAVGQTAPTPHTTENRTFRPGEEIAFHTMPLASGNAVIAFTSLEMLQLSVDRDLPYLRLPFRSLVEMTQFAAIALNPCGPYGKEYTPSELRLAAGGLAVRNEHELVVTRSTKVLLGRLAHEPDELLSLILTACRADKSLRSAFISGICFPEAGETTAHPLIGIDAADYGGAREVVKNAVSDWAMRTGIPVDMVDMRVEGELQRHLLTSGRRFYQHRTWLQRLFSS